MGKFKKIIVFLVCLFLASFGLLQRYDVFANSENEVVNEASLLLVNESTTISVLNYDEVFINEKLINEDTTLIKSGKYDVKYININKVIAHDENGEMYDEEGNPILVDEITETLKTYYIVNLNIEDDEVYANEIEINLDVVDGVTYYLNDEEVSGAIFAQKEGINTLKIKTSDKEKSINFEIFKFNNKEDINGKRFLTIPSVEYTANTNAQVFVNGNIFDGSISKIGNYLFEAKNKKGELIDELEFTVSATVRINNIEYKDIEYTDLELKTLGYNITNSNVELKTSTNSFAKIEYDLDCVNVSLSNNDIYSGFVTYNPGMNTLVLKGEGSYSLTIKFKNNPTTNIISNHKYNAEVLPIISGGKMLINGYEFNQGNKIDTAGLYEMVIKGLETDAAATYKFEVTEEAMNVDAASFSKAIIPAKTNNYMTINDEIYHSGDVISKAGLYTFKIYYPTYNEIDNALDAKELSDSFIKSKYVMYKEYTFEIKKGINIENNKEYYDSKQILFSGVSDIELTFEGNTSLITKSGYLANKVGDYELIFDGSTYNFSITPRLNVEENQVYFDNVVVLNNYDFSNGVKFTLECETGTTESNKISYSGSDILKKSLGVGSYKLNIETDFGYKKEVSFIVISSNVINRGAAYNNAKSFDFNMYGVKAYLNAPETFTRNRSTTLYQNEKILTVGKHYFIFEFNGISTKDDETAVFFYIKPVVTFNEVETTSINLKVDFEALLTFKDGNGEDIENDYYTPLSLDNKSNNNQIIKDSNSIYTFNEIGIHYIDLKLDGYSYKITLTIDSYFYVDEIKEENKVSSEADDTYLTTKNIYQTEVKFVNVSNDYLAGYKLDDNDDVNGIKINEVGNHKLYLYGTNGYKKVLVFVIEERVELSTNDVLIPQNTYDTYTFNTSIILNIYGDGEYLLDTNTYQNAKVIDMVGNHLLVIKGKNGYTKNYRFKINESLNVTYKGLVNNEFNATYDEAFDFGINYDKCLTCKLNESDIAGITTIDTIGNYTLKITGTNDYVAIYTFKVLPTLSFVSNDSIDNKILSSYKRSVTPTLDNSKGLRYQEVTLNGAAYDFSMLNDVNSYSLLLKGVGGYKEEYSFNIKESLLYSFDNLNYLNVSNRLIDPKDDSLGKKIYIKKEFSDINYLNSKLNGEAVSDNELSDFIIIDNLGNNKLVINNVTYEIKLREINSNLYQSEKEALANKLDKIDEIKFDDELIKDIKLDNQAYDGSSISSFGLHKVLVSGINYNNTYYFYINLDTNIINGKDYYTNVEISSNSKEVVVLADTKKIEGKLDTVGTYNVTFNGLYNSKEVYKISLKSAIICNNELLESKIETKEIINISYETDTNHYKNATLNGNDYNFDLINTIGNNVLELFDINNNVIKYTLTINSDNYINSNVYDNILEANNNKTNNFVLDVNSNYIGLVKLDNKVATLDFNNNQYGLHMVSVIGVNNYQHDYYFDIKLESNLESKVYKLAKDIEMNAYFEIDSKAISSIDEVGNHKAIISKYNIDSFEYEEVDFVIAEVVSGFDRVNHRAVLPVIEGNINSISLSNVDNYQIGDKLYKAGKYLLSINGTNDYKNVYEFEIIPDIIFNNYDFKSLINNKEVAISELDDEILFDVYLNDVLFDINKPIDTIGNNKVEIRGFDYSKTYTIILNEITNINSYSYKASDSFVPNVTNMRYEKALINDIEYDLLPITFFGTYVYKVIGVNDYTSVYTFDIELDTNLINNNEYLKNINATANSDIYINDVKTNKSSLIGFNEVTFKGVGKEVCYNVLIKEVVEGFNNDIYKANALINISNISSITLDGEVIEGENGIVELKINEVGNHSFIINGLNDYHSEAYKFVVVEDLPLLENDDTFTNSIIISVDNVKELSLNGMSFNSGDEVSLIGNYVLEVIGVNGYSNEYKFKIVYAITGIENDGVYVGHAEVTAQNVMMELDGKKYNSGDVITEVGYHKLVVCGDGSEKTYIYDFTILPDLSQNEIISDYELNNVVINDPKSFYVDSASNLKLYLNDEEYDGSLISKAGIYKLELKGANGYEKEFNFTFDVDVKEIKAIYNKPFNPEISTSLEYNLLLNGNEYLNNTLIDEAGNYKLTIEGVNGYVKEFDFVLDVEVEEIKSVYNDVFTPIISNELKSVLTLNDMPYQIDSVINKVGNYKLEIEGNNYHKEYLFVIKENLNYLINEEEKPLINNLKLDDCLEIINNNNLEFKALLNNKEINNLNNINDLGNNIIEIIGEGDYVSTYNILLTEKLNFVNKDTYKENDSFTPALVNNLKANIYVDGNVNDTLKDYGKHLISVSGVNGYQKDYELYVELDTNIINKNTYNKLVEIKMNSKFLVDSIEYENICLLDMVGNHKIEALGLNNETKTFEIVVSEFVLGIENNKEYNDFVTIKIDNAELLLNGEEYISNTKITNVGNYKLDVKGCNGYKNSYEFVILNKDFEYDSKILDKEISIDIPYAKLVLDNEEIDNNTVVNLVGLHYLDVIGVNDYKKSYSFTINNTYFENNLTTDKKVMIDIPNAKLYVDDEEIENKASISAVGNHKLVVEGTNGYKKAYDFVIENKAFENNLNTFDTVIIDIPNAKLVLDGNEIENNSKIKSVGIHYLDVIGTNDYKKSYVFTINNTYFENNLKANDAVIINIPNAKLYVDGELIENNTAIKAVGNHKLVVEGTNEYVNTYEFVILNKEFENNLSTTDTVIIDIPNAKLVLDGNEIDNNSKIKSVGIHYLDVIGTNDYKKSYVFTINNIEFENNQLIKSDILINIPNSSLYLDGEEIKNNSIIRNVGNHILEVRGTNDYEKTYEFIILNKDFTGEEFEGSTTIDIPYAKLYVDGKEIENFTTINEIGNHILEVSGINNYSKKYKFTITPDKKIVQTESSNGYVANIMVSNDYKDIKIDDISYENGIDYKSVGNHTLKIYGTNGYVYTENFTVEALTKVNDTGIYKDKLVIKSLEAEEMLLDGKEITKDKVVSNGEHILVIKGANGYEKIVTFTYDNPNDFYVIVYTIILVTVFVTSYVCVFIYRNKKKNKVGE